MEELYYRIEEDYWKNFFDKVGKLTTGKLDIKGDFISLDTILGSMENLVSELEETQKKLEDLQEDLRENYKHI